jgi:hypothetical protein
MRQCELASEFSVQKFVTGFVTSCIGSHCRFLAANVNTYTYYVIEIKYNYSSYRVRTTQIKDLQKLGESPVNQLVVGSTPTVGAITLLSVCFQT